MIILTANENLLERLALLVQNNPRGNAAHPPVRAQTVLIASSASGGLSGLPAHLLIRSDSDDDGTSPCSSPRNWVLLMGKKSFGEHLSTLQTLADLYRLSMTLMRKKELTDWKENQMRILIIKKERSDDDEQCLQEHLDAVRTEWAVDWGAHVEKFRKFGESDAQNEHLLRATNWSDPSVPNCALSYFDDPNLLEAICSFFALGVGGFQIVGQSAEEDSERTGENRRQLFTKPPALHWTNYPRDSEVQVTFKFTFPTGTITEWVFREWTKMGKHSLCWDYVYEWTNGVLLRAEELVKVTITRSSTSANVVEVAGRIDMDEAAEEMEQHIGGVEDNDNNSPPPTPSCPLQRVWPYLVRPLQGILADLEKRRTLPFALSLVFIGDIFFNGPEDAPKVSARSLDATQTLSSIQRVGVVRFRVDQQHIYSLNLAQCFPCFFPTKLADFAAVDRFVLPPTMSPSGVPSSSASSPSADGATTGTSLLGSALPSERQTPTLFHRTERSPSCIPAIALSLRMSGEEGTDKTPLSPSNSLLVERHLSKHRSRRVSFGVIHAIPSLDGGESTGKISPGNASPSLIRPTNRCSVVSPSPANCNREEIAENATDEDKQHHCELVENVVEEMLQKAIKEVLVTD
ncbi:hypothetical protein GPALN_001979 [Globodera pallida]|nr:hypothetical protein GPALN_001979 [Globodera pallida]